MPKATDQLLKDHKMIRKTLEGFTLGNPRFALILETLQRIILAHAWFEDELFLPALEAEPLLDKRYAREIVQEHEDLAHFLRRMRRTPAAQKKEWEIDMLQFRSLLDMHLLKEEAGLFPAAERLLGEERLDRLAAEMERRKAEARGAADRQG
ncbi:MAG TPA: hemerythrin domain-containing protein [Elusimicrobiota bacterium]|nr:hemerythrin domain-containing protein [Elusimicrobiota bacterium]